jgi:Ca2+/Na+ antiporter
MNDDLLYHERMTSNRTEALFLTLTLLFFVLMIWRVRTDGLDALAAVFLSFFIIFLFYSLNYRVLIVRLTPESLKLTFGIFTWIVALDNIGTCALDDVPAFMRMGGAGIHFMLIRKRYRASFNFLEYPRVVIEFKRKVGPVRDISFSTRQPDEVQRLIQEIYTANSDAWHGLADSSPAPRAEANEPNHQAAR